ncbi:hypothetical protein [Flammeovirga sp. EKP202]|uniref:hypothetical protein n=1 Tax=Flammeovirga sp. EKP202 TaxID=2770592 RepID=UPI00165EC451|nr:hypothetical protein [Flammeovirga sp. EKP202]
MLSYFKIITLLSFLWFIIHEVFIIVDGISAQPRTSEYAVILGNKVNENGTLSQRLQARVDKGFEIYTKRLVQKIVVSGGFR